MTEPLATATAARAFSPALYRAARVLRMGGGEMLSFLQNEAALNPFLRIENERDWLRPDDDADLDCAAAAADDGEAQNPREHLRAALFETAAAADPRVAALAREMCEWVDDDGFFPDAESEFAADPRFAAALDLLQSAGPPGLAARDLRECLLLQLAAQKPAPSAPAADLADWRGGARARRRSFAGARSQAPRPLAAPPPARRLAPHRIAATAPGRAFRAAAAARVAARCFVPPPPRPLESGARAGLAAVGARGRRRRRMARHRRQSCAPPPSPARALSPPSRRRGGARFCASPSSPPIAKRRFSNPARARLRRCRRRRRPNLSA